MVEFEDKNGELYIRVTNIQDALKPPKATVTLSTQAAYVIEELCSETGLKPKQAASELILFAAAHLHVKKAWDPDDWRVKDYKHFRDSEK